MGSIANKFLRLLIAFKPEKRGGLLVFFIESLFGYLLARHLNSSLKDQISFGILHYATGLNFVSEMFGT